MKEFYTTGEVAKLCGISPMTVINYCESGRIEAEKSPITNRRRIPRESLVTFMAEFGISVDQLDAADRKRIFIVDDDQAEIDILKDALMDEDAGYVVESSTSGYEACVRIGSFKPDLVVLDLVMPKTDGFEVCQCIKNTPETRKAKVLIVTGYSGESNIRKALSLGADDWLAKPFRITEFCEKVAALLKSPFSTASEATPG